MGLKVFLTDKESAHAPEAKAFYELAFTFKKVFAEYDWNGILLGNPIRSNRPVSWADAILFEENSIIIIDFKHWGGKITLPNEQNFQYGEWRSDKSQTTNSIKGGEHYNPFAQLMDYRRELKEMLIKSISLPAQAYINTGVIFHGNNVDLSDAIIPGKFKNYFFVSKSTKNPEDTDSYYTNICAVINGSSKNRQNAVCLTERDFSSIRNLFLPQHEIKTEEISKYFDDNNWQKERETLNNNLQAALREKENAIYEKEKLARDKERFEKQAKAANEALNKTTVALSQERVARIETQREATEAKGQASFERLRNQTLVSKNEELEKTKISQEKEIETLKRQKSQQEEEVEEYKQKLEKAIKDNNGEEIKRIQEKLNDLSYDLKNIDQRIIILNNPAKSPSKKKIALLLSTIILLVIAIVAIIITTVNNSIKATLEAETTVQMPTRPENLEGPYKAYVIDGDTISVYINKQQTHIRLIGIEAPEAKNDHNNTAECYGEQAKSYLIKKIGGKEIYLETDNTQKETDVYGRLMKYVWLGDELINQTLLSEGYAKELTFDATYKYRDNFAKAQKMARDNSLGLWSKCQ